MIEILKKILEVLIIKARKKEFVFRFDVYNGTESSKEIYDAQVVQYEFFNTGTTNVRINNGLILYAPWTGMKPTSILLNVNECEMDTTIYKFDFITPDLIISSTGQQVVGPGPTYTNFIPGISAYKPGMISLQYPEFNQLTVVSKVKASLKKKQHGKKSTPQKKR